LLLKHCRKGSLEFHKVIALKNAKENTKMKKYLFLTALCAIGLCSCYYEENADATIKISNKSSQDLRISFYPNTFTYDNIGSYNEKVTVNLRDANVKKGESFLLVVKYRYKEKSFGTHNSIRYFINLSDVEKIIFSKMGTGELIKEAFNFRDLLIRGSGLDFYTLEITDELLNTEGE
jgi:hypothetical protein